MHRLIALVAVAIPYHPGAAQLATEASRVQAAVIEAVRADAPPATYSLYANADEHAVAQATARLARVGLRETARGARPSAIGRDTIGIHLTVDTLEANIAIVTIHMWGALPKSSRHAPTSWYEERRARLERRNGHWVVVALNTLMET